MTKLIFSLPMLEKIFNRRCQGYEVAGYKILLPASAIPGGLPKYRLSLAHLFVQEKAFFSAVSKHYAK